MRVAHYHQGSPAWHTWRSKKMTASSSAVVMRANPNWNKKSWVDLADMRRGVPEEPVSEFVRNMRERGHLMERVIQHRFLPRAFPAALERGNYAASLDGWCAPDLEWLEAKNHRAVKAPLLLGLQERGHTGPEWRELPGLIDDLLLFAPHIGWQLVHQAAVIGNDRARCLLVSYHSSRAWAAAWYSSHELLKRWPDLEAEWKRYTAWEQRYRALKQEELM